MNYGFVYETVNHINGMKYIGKHKRSQDLNDPDDSWYLGSGKYLSRAIEKYGSENFSRSILCECDSEKELQEMERYHINQVDAVNSDKYYNLVEDANPPLLFHGQNPERDKFKSDLFKIKNPSFKEENKEKISRRMRESNPMSNPETVEKMRDSKIGQSLSEEHKQNLSEAHKGIIFSEDHRRHLSESQIGKVISEGTKEKISNTLKRLNEDPDYKKRRKEIMKNTRYPKICVICGEDFIGLSSRSKYCPPCKGGRL